MARCTHTVPTAITYSSEDVAKQVANISWSSLPIANQTYIMSVKNKSGYMESFKLYEPYYLFTAPEGAPPCEVYNFSVTATYVGANYTGAGCSVLSPVLSRMLPSLPYIIASWESSLNYSLKKNSSGGFALRVTFMVSYHLVHASSMYMHPIHVCSLPTTVICILLLAMS